MNDYFINTRKGKWFIPEFYGFLWTVRGHTFSISTQINENVNIYFSNQLISMDQPNVQIAIRVGKVYCLFVCLMVFNATFNNISVISWRSVLLVEETGGPGENHRPVASH
jgi:hypothetical protein